MQRSGTPVKVTSWQMARRSTLCQVTSHETLRRMKMQLLSEVSRPYMMDFKLEPLEYLEETSGPTIRVRVQNLEIDLPASWCLVAVDRETYTIDSIPITACATFEHDILLFSPDDSKLVTTKLS